MNIDPKKNLISAFNVLGNPIKMKIFLKIVDESCGCGEQDGKITKNCITGIMKSLNIPQSTVSMYIQDLKKAGLIVTSKIGKVTYCKPNIFMLREFNIFIKNCINKIK